MRKTVLILLIGISLYPYFTRWGAGLLAVSDSFRIEQPSLYYGIQYDKIATYRLERNDKIGFYVKKEWVSQ